MEGRKRNIVCLIVSLFFILYITILSRVPTLTRTVHLLPLWSYLSSGHWRQILLNIFLFIPLGYFLTALYSKFKHLCLWTIFSALTVSIGIELIQFFTCRGMLDVDDLISNSLGAAVGLLIYKPLERKKYSGVKKWIPESLLFAGFIGCIIVAVSTAEDNMLIRITEQFDFAISSATVKDETVYLEGTCFTYDRTTPNYTLVLDGVEVETNVNGKRFEASIILPKGKSELQIHFDGYEPMPTGVWLKLIDSIVSVDYVSEDVDQPEGIGQRAVLKAFSPEYDTYVYQDGNRIIRYIGWEELDSSTEIIYHLRTNTPELLPAKRRQYRFDNRGFRLGSDKETTVIGRFRVFEDIIPDYYNVTAIVVGFNTQGTITWIDSFRVGDYAVYAP